MGPARRPGSIAAVAAVLLALAAGCRRDEVTFVRVPKGQAGAPSASAGGEGIATARADLPPPASTEGRALAWTLPKGWTQGPGDGMRFATLKPAAQERIEVSVVVLPGSAGGELANVNRWRGQIGLPAIDEAALGSMRRMLRTRAGPVSVYDFSSEGETKSRVVAGLAVAAGNTWFIKMTGGAEPVAAAKPDFIRLLESLRIEASN